MYKAQIYIQYIEIYTAYVLFIFLGVQLEKYLKDSGQGANNEKKCAIETPLQMYVESA